MALDIYWIALLLLLPAVVLVSGRGLILRPFKRFRRDKKDDTNVHMQATGRQKKDEEGRKFRRMFLEVYLLVMGSEWLQGPYLYSLLRDEKNLDEATVASMYVTGYIGAAVAALGTGFMADRYGRRLACLVFCLIHTAAGFSVLSDNLVVLYTGRALAGVALTLLWTVFESWMVTEYNTRGLDRSSISLSRMFGLMTTSNCMAATLGGVVAHCIVLVLGSRTIPFVSGVVLEATAVVLMLRNWNENFGQPAEDVEFLDEPRGNLLGDTKVWILSFVACCFEGTNFLVLFFWPGILQDAHRAANPEGPAEVPYGVIFATFMSAMILGAQFFNTVVQDRRSPAQGVGNLHPWVQKLIESNNLLSIAIVAAGASLLATVYVKNELGILLAFLGFEVCNGLYVPCIAYQRGIVVNETNRAGLYGLMKLPLFIFVITALLTAVEGKVVFLACFVALFVASLVSFFGLRHGDKARRLLAQDDPEDFEFELADEEAGSHKSEGDDSSTATEVEIQDNEVEARS
ncbi:MFS general substrate transporter [Thozetella sp. PMI_491]|nr:MFS general substrate transporter [Thozetella sp. PMI_491]